MRGATGGAGGGARAEKGAARPNSVGVMAPGLRLRRFEDTGSPAEGKSFRNSHYLGGPFRLELLYYFFFFYGRCGMGALEAAEKVGEFPSVYHAVTVAVGLLDEFVDTSVWAEDGAELGRRDVAIPVLVKVSE